MPLAEGSTGFYLMVEGHEGAPQPAAWDGALTVQLDVRGTVHRERAFS